MTLKDLIQSNSWLSIETILLKLYPGEEVNRFAYLDVFEELLYMNPEDAEIEIVVANQTDDFDGEEYVDVSGSYKNPKNEEEEFSQALEFTPWNEWLGMEISQESLHHFTELEVIAHCLFEMTFIGFEEEVIQEEMESIQSSMEDYLNMPEEEKEENTISFEDIFKDLDDEEETEEGESKE
ncbi:hypothetical protein ERX46_02080 [Brumimicrobium glaciale]|uniref:Uncharacterized protein n=1 Tax=Brumimicrobium glaciale TaxID=200475 RepID=A0A4Q4KQM7_9FLAO|nr:DUF6557 family protein [Brumimicrobium glaciale]RYM35806.1 hypothetical protein ERX46_02080 [Brumimicrobium glaciale]